MLMANAGVVAGTADAAPGTWRRFAAYMIQAFSAAAARPCHPRPPPPRCTGRCCICTPASATNAAAAG